MGKEGETLCLEYSIKKLPLKALKWAQFAGASRAYLPFTISFISYHIISYHIHIQTLYHFPHMMFFLSITNLVHFFHTYIKIKPNIIFPLCIPSIFSQSHLSFHKPFIIIHNYVKQTIHIHPDTWVNLCHHIFIVFHYKNAFSSHHHHSNMLWEFVPLPISLGQK